MQAKNIITPTQIYIAEREKEPHHGQGGRDPAWQRRRRPQTTSAAQRSARRGERDVAELTIFAQVMDTTKRGG